jgi:uncharacterized protein
MDHPVVWFEVMGKDGAAQRSFYEKLFGWKIEVMEAMNYGMVEACNGRGIPGGVGQLGDTPQPKVTFYVSTGDINASLKKAETLGGKTLMPRTALPGGTTLGMFADVEGNAVGLVEEAEG